MMGLVSENLLLQFVGIIITIAGAIYLYLKHVAYHYWSSKGIAQSTPTIPFGNLWPVITAKKSVGQLMRDLYLDCRENRMFGVYSFHKPTLVVCDPEIIRFIMTKEFTAFQDRGLYHNEKIDPMSGQLFLLSGPKWRPLRVKFTSTFTTGKIKQMFSLVKEVAVKLGKCTAKEVDQIGVVEVKDLMARFNTDVITAVAFGLDSNSLENPEAEFRAWGRKLLEPQIFKNMLMTLYPSIITALNISFNDKGTSDFIINIVKDSIAHRTANHVIRKDFMDLVIQLITKGFVNSDDGKDGSQDPAASEKITLLEGAAQVFVFWVAGFETSSSAATHCLYEMAMNQDIQEKLAEEINTVLEKFGSLTYDSIMEMSYLDKVISETLRKYPSFPILNRQCNREVELPETGFVIPVGTPIIFPVLGIHHDPEIYPEPERFDPERFNQENIAKRHQYAYLPFGKGPRNCIGMKFGLLQTKIGIITLLSEYRFKPGPDTKDHLPTETKSFFLTPRGQLMSDLYSKFKKNRIFGIYSFHKANLVVCDPEVIRFILTKEFRAFQDRGMYRNEKLEPLLGNIFLVEGLKWRRLRAKFSPTFTTVKTKNMFSTVRKIADNLSKQIVKETNRSDLVEMKDLMASLLCHAKRFSTDVIALAAFGIKSNSLENPQAEFHVCGQKLVEPKPVRNALATLCPSVMKMFNIKYIDKEISNLIITVCKNSVEYRRANNVVRNDFMDLVIQLMTKGYVNSDHGKNTQQDPVTDNEKITLLEAAAQVFIFWFGGFETSSTTATYCLYEMAMNQVIQEKLADEINSVIQKFGSLTYDSITEMTYLDKVISETLRKYPSFMILNRECNREVELPETGFVVPVGTPIVVPVLGIHRDPDIYPEPEKFDPERFNQENTAKRHRYAYLPFGQGPRNCIVVSVPSTGMKFGLLQTKIGIITLLSEYRFKPGPDTKVPLPADTGNFFLTPQGRVTLRVEKREKNKKNQL
ncbi:probable cytochrome P450 6a14 [Neodiprion virginianus]|uniref:probable cytochrome P450 6a14 n=1 Tax=Neodiprion virginianus TaxID=2961670 RepID=UPI001EE7110F|nr:probable cytochrome P450 6a14 [Neodiprion virginianus]